MPKLSIEIFGYEAEIVVGTITKDQKKQLETYCENNDENDEECLDSVWYGEQEVMEEIVGEPYWDQIDNMFHGSGFVFYSEEYIKETFKEAKILLDDKEISLDVEKIKYRFKDPEPLPKPANADEIAVRAGLACRGTYTYQLEVADGFDESKLVLSFDDLTNLYTDRFMMDPPEYDGDEMDLSDCETRPKMDYDLVFFEQKPKGE